MSDMTTISATLQTTDRNAVVAFLGEHIDHGVPVHISIEKCGEEYRIDVHEPTDECADDLVLDKTQSSAESSP